MSFFSTKKSGHKNGGPECLLQDVVVLRPHAPLRGKTEVTGVCFSDAQCMGYLPIHEWLNFICKCR